MRMIEERMTLDQLLELVPGLAEEAVLECVEQGWIRPEQDPSDGLVFDKTDFARLRLVFELRYDFEVPDESVSVVLALLDQIYDLRRVIRRVGAEVTKGERVLARQKALPQAPAARALEMPAPRLPDGTTKSGPIPIAKVRL